MGSILGVILWQGLLISTPSLPPVGWVLVEARCEKCTELRGGMRSDTFLIQRASHTPKLFVGQEFSVEYRDLSQGRVWNRDGRILWLYPFAIDDRAFFWAYRSDDNVVVVSDLNRLWSVQQHRDTFMNPIRPRSVRPGDEVLVAGASAAYTFGTEVMKIISASKREERVELLRKASLSENRELAAWAKWALDKYYKPRFVRVEEPSGTTHVHAGQPQHIVLGKTWEEVERVLGEEASAITNSGPAGNFTAWFPKAKLSVKFDPTTELFVGYPTKR